MKTKTTRIAMTTLSAALFAASAQAGGPLYLFDADQPFAWDVSNPIPVYTDMGDLCDDDPNWPHAGCITNDQANTSVAFGFEQWTGVESSSFQAEIVGNFDDLGLGDISSVDAGKVIGVDNGGGYHVMYDSDRSIMEDFFGIYGGGVLGISSPEWADGDTITESWAVIGVDAVPQGDDGTKTAGVMTHEFGHGINLAHSQANGAVTFLGAPWYWIAWAPRNCGAPYDVSPIEDWVEYQEWIFNTAIPNTETMYPFIQPNETGVEMSTVDRPDDIAAVSNIYPANGWPASHGAISGEILLKDGSTGLTGVNVVARNIADPLGDVVTVMSGDHTQGVIGPDGRYTINGLTPGAEYVVYVENIYAGGFPTPPATLPSFQEYWNSGESADAASDDPCEWTNIPVTAGSNFNADIVFQGIERAPTFIQIPVPSATDVNNSGHVVAGTYGGQVAWRYDIKSGEFEAVAAQGTPKLTRDGHTMAINLTPELPPWEGGIFQPAFWNSQKGLTLMHLPEDEPGCDGTIFSPFGLDSKADTVVGLAYKDGCSRGSWHPDGPNKFYAGAWTEEDGLQYLETPDWVEIPNCTWDWQSGEYLDGCEVRGTRANAISGNGKLIAGHVDANGWKGAAWIDGKLVTLGEDDPKGWIGSANAVNHDGTAVVGGEAGSDEWDWGNEAYLWTPEAGTRALGNFVFPCEEIDPWSCPWTPEIVFPTQAFGVTDKADMVVGRAGDFWNGFFGFIWMEELGMVNLDEFLQGQGVMEAYTGNMASPLSISGDGKTIVGWGFSDISMISFAVTLDQVWVCRKGKSSLAGFPGGMLSQLKRGAELGLCEADRPITPGS